jgi:hypothetical protein
VSDSVSEALEPSPPTADPEPATIPDHRPTKPHDRKICEAYASYLADDSKWSRQRATQVCYDNIRDLSLILMMKKYGYSPRIDTDTIAHEVATSALMTVIVRGKTVDSWTNLIRKITHDLSNKWMKAHLYSNNAKTVSLDDHEGDGEDGEGMGAAIDVPCHDMDPGLAYMYYHFLDSTVRRAVRVLDGIGAGPRNRVTARLALSHASGTLPLPVLQSLPAAVRHRVQYYAFRVRQILVPVFSSRHFERTFF